MSLKNTNSYFSRISDLPIFKNVSSLNHMPYPEIPIVENPVHKTNKTIQELKDIIIQQSINGDKQAIINKRLTYFALMLAFIPIVIECIPIIFPKNDDYDIKNKLLLISNTNLENQVKILRLENELLKSKKTYEKGKKTP